ncbi:hypothetical protein DFH27DRAFT_598290 [Peziza echinospora]|nr:hypothetical protein DFH27DRAFT_598290 [Peziza echinospora]
MPSRVLLSTEAIVSEEALPVATKRRLKAENVKPFIQHEDGTGQSTAKRQKPNAPREKKFACTHPGCDKIFNRPCRLTQHLNTHTGDRPFVCTYTDCGKSFFRNTHLRAHINSIHENLRTHHCTFPECTQSFTTAQHLKRHVSSHTSQHPHKCQTCEESFRKKTQLERHVRATHLGLKPFACKHQSVDGENGEVVKCPEAFETKGKLEGHVHREHRGGGGAKYFCEECLMQEGGKEGQDDDDDDDDDDDGRFRNQLSWITADSILVWPEDDDGQHDSTSSHEHQDLGNNNNNNDNRENKNNDEIEEETAASTIQPTPTTATPPSSSGSTAPTSAPPASTTAGTFATRLGFKTYHQLQYHIRTVHPPICKTCGKICKSNRDLRAHISENHADPLHIRKGNFVCNWVSEDDGGGSGSPCGQGFPRRWGLLVHQRTVHEKKRPFECPFEGCGRRFGYKSAMEGHYNTHLNPGAGGKKQRRGGRRQSMSSMASSTVATRDQQQQQQQAQSQTAPPAPALLLTKLTGVGYASLRRNIPCVVEGCEFRFLRRYDLLGHLRATHGFGERQVQEIEEVHLEKARGAGGGCGSGGVDGYAGFSDSSGSEYEED